MLVEFLEAFRWLARSPGAGHKREDLAEDRAIPAPWVTINVQVEAQRWRLGLLDIGRTELRITALQLAFATQKLELFSNPLPGQ